MRTKDGVLGVLLLLAAGGLLRWPVECAQSVRDGLAMFGGVILPALFPFFVLSSLVVELGLSRYLGGLLQGVMGPLFRLSGPCAGAVALGAVGGYPTGARTVFALYNSGQCSRSEGEHLLAFCNCSGPAFILGVVGGGIFGSGYIGLLLYGTHLLAALLVGLLFRGRGSAAQTAVQTVEFRAVPFAAALTKSILSAAQSLINLCAFILFFSVTLRVLTLSGILPVLTGALVHVGAAPQTGQILLSGVLELSNGISALRGCRGPGPVVLAAFLLGWGSLSIHCQVLALNSGGLSMRPYLLGKLLHGCIAAGLTALFLHWGPVEAGHFPAVPIHAGPSPLLVWGISAALPWVIVFRQMKKISGNRP